MAAEKRKNQLHITGKYLWMDKDEIIVTKTDLTGKLEYGNRTFFKYAGYSKPEALGKQHNIVRHPEMPRTVFKLLWDTIQKGEEIFAYVNNRAKNGDSYWVLAHVTPSKSITGEINGFHSNRRLPRKDVLTDHIEPLYKTLMDIERNAGSPKKGLEEGVNHITKILDESQVGFNELMFSLGV